MKTIKVSIIIAVKNEKRYIEKAIKSIINQSLEEIEVIIIDDHSTDDTLKILKTNYSENKKIKIYQNKSKGKVSAFNLGLSVAKGEFICLFAGDDIMPENSLKQRYDLIKESKKTLVVGLSKLKIISNNKKYNNKIYPRNKTGYAFTGTSYLMSKDFIEKVYPIPESLPNEDSFLYLAVKYLPNVKIIPSHIIGNYWRVHSKNSMGLSLNYKTFNSKYTQRNKSIFLFYNKFKEILDPKNKKIIENLILAEEYRIKNKIIHILLLKLPLNEKLRALAYSNSVLYTIKKILIN